MAAGNGALRYTVLYAAGVHADLQRWADRAVAVGRLGAFAAILLDMQDRLVYQPVAWADTGWDAPGQPGLKVYLRHTLYLGVEYSVSELERTVRITRVFLPPGSPLADPGPPA